MTDQPESKLAELQNKISSKTAVIGVIGLGYVGLPVAASFAQAGFEVVGLDIKEKRVEIINSGSNPIAGEEPGLAELLADENVRERLKATTDGAELARANVILIDVETPINEDHQPNYDALRSACQSLGATLEKGMLVIVESTVAPGTTGDLVRPLLEKLSGLREGVDFYLGACPERVMPGKLLKNLRSMSRVCGGSSQETARTMVTLYRHIVDADLDIADPLTAEIVKTTENAYRDVQIAFANEIALICEALGADVWKVRDLVNKVPSRQMHLPGAGVGGHCIPKDPWLLAYSVREKEEAILIPQARAINDGMPLHMVDLTLDALEEAGISIAGTSLVVMGYSYLENSDDTRNTPSATVVERLSQLGAKVKIHDPWIEQYSGDFAELIIDSDALIVMVAHRQYYSLELTKIQPEMKTPVIVDGRRIFDVKDIKSAGFIYRGVGQGTQKAGNDH